MNIILLADFALGTISLIGRDLSPEGSAVVHCHFKTYDKSLFPGTYMNAEVQIKALNL